MENLSVKILLRNDYVIKRLKLFIEELELHKENHIDKDDIIKMIEKILIKWESLMKVNTG